ncbi:MAG: hypothetical protein OEQ13_11035, partial [Acidobacteriota bacterium]|nr:hypothetical protein [Acidobacteriota bacterium]
SQFGNINRSTDGGSTFVTATSGIDTSERANWVTPIGIDPVVPFRLYTGRQKVYRSDDSAVSWTAISDDVTDTGPGGSGPSPPPAASEGSVAAHLENLVRSTITVVKASAVDNQVVWAGTDDGNVWVTSDGGSSWSNVNPPGLDHWVTDVAPDPFDASKCYLTVTGYRVGDRVPYVLLTDDLGQTWTDASLGLPQVPVNTVSADPLWPGQVFIGNDVGVYLTDDGGASWQAMSTGMPVQVVLDLVLHGPTRTLYAGTHGRGIYSYDLTPLPPPDRDGDGVVNVNDCAPDDGGAFSVPAEVSPITIDEGPSGESILTWTSLAPQAGTGTEYDAASDTLASLRSIGGATGFADLDCGVAGTTTTDARAASPGDGFAYLVRGRNACATGAWGRDSDDVERAVTSCP